MNTTRTTPEFINTLLPGEIFVFGSNTEGRHGAGAARMAAKVFGAEYGVAEGLTGSTYAIPTVDFSLGRERYPMEKVEGHILTFLSFAEAHPSLVFLVTLIGTGIAGFSVEDVGGILSKYRDRIPDNVVLPQEFLDVILQK